MNGILKILEILENLIDLMDSALKETKLPDQERHQNPLPDGEKPFFLSTSSTCDQFFLHRHKEVSQPKTHVQHRRHSLSFRWREERSDPCLCSNFPCRFTSQSRLLALTTDLPGTDGPPNIVQGIIRSLASWGIKTLVG